MAGQSRSGTTPRSRNRGGSASLYVAVALIAVAAIALAYMALSGVHIGGPASGSSLAESTATSEPVATPVQAAPQPVSVALVSDEDGNVAGSWWSQSVSAGAVPGVQSGPVASQAGATIETLAGLLDSATVPAGGFVVVQAGTPELADGQDPAEVLLSVQSLWAGVRERGGIPIAALVPPSDDEPAAVAQFNELMRAAAATQTVPVLDVYTAVAAADGSWAPGFSDDGVQVSAAGSTVMAQAVVAQLPALAVTAP
jgi:lysophospholipase L1-like esterase